MTEMREHELLEDHEGSEWEQRRERLVRLTKLDAEGRAAVAGAKVAADERPRPAPQPLGYFAKLESHLVAGQEAGFGGFR
jgi:hypothetical protein